MPRPPRFVVLEKHESANPGTPGVVPRNDLAFPVICKSVEACGEPPYVWFNSTGTGFSAVPMQSAMPCLPFPDSSHVVRAIVVRPCRTHCVTNISFSGYSRKKADWFFLRGVSVISVKYRGSLPRYPVPR